MKQIKKLSALVIISYLLLACNETTYQMQPLLAPSDIKVTTKIKGASTTHPDGDGSGEVTFQVTAKNVINYQFFTGTDKGLFSSGTYQYFFSKIGTHTYDFTIVAQGAGGITSSFKGSVKVLVNYVPPADLLKTLHGTSEKTWRIKKQAKGHLGVGPASKDFAEWWSANPNDKDGKGVYDDRITFKKEGTYTYQTNGTAFGKKAAMDADIPAVAALGKKASNSDGDYENIALKPFTGTWKILPPKSKETLYLSDIGYLGMYVGGNHKYWIQKRSENQISVRTIGKDGNAWYMILIAD